MNKRNKKQRNLHKVEQGIWIVLLSVFLLSSVLKAVNINSFALETRLYLDAYFWDLKSVMSGFGTIIISLWLVGEVGNINRNILRRINE